MPTFQVNPKYAVLTELVPGLYICGVSSLKPQLLANVGITCVINCTREVPNLHEPEGERLKLWLEDTENEDILNQMEMVVDRMHEVLMEEGGKVLVHCVAGVSRSAAFALGYMVKYCNLSLKQAYKYCAVKRPLVRPNLGFWRQLIEFEIYVRGGSPSVAIVTYGLDVEAYQYLPDVYFEELCSKENSPPAVDPGTDYSAQSNEGLKRRRSSASRFVPKLAPVPELEP